MENNREEILEPMKKCKHCKSEIPKSAKVCPYCRKKQKGILKWIIIAGVVFWIILSMNNGSDYEEPVQKENAQMQEEQQEVGAAKTEESEISEDAFTYDHMTVKYLRHEVAVNDMGETVLIVYYDFTNNNKDNKAFVYCFDDTCFQNGVEAESSFWHANEESKNREKEIKTGTTVTIASSFVLEDTTTAVDLEITTWLGSRVFFRKTLELE